MPWLFAFDDKFYRMVFLDGGGVVHDYEVDV